MAITPAQTCPKCGRPLSARAPQGLCRSCLAGSLLGPEPEPETEPLLEPGGPRQFGDYELIEEIARGGMGIVYRARQISLNRQVALKMILAGQVAGRDSLQMFRREARAAANLHHPNIVPVYEIGEHELQDYFTMRLVPGGRTIADWAATQRGNWKVLAAAVAQAARAVAHAHAHGVLHRDLKPSNILWDDEAGPQVTDFGLAKLLDEADLGLTRSHHVMGSPGYMAPEQTGGRAAEITTATDVYGLGAVLYELLTGRPPFAGTSTVETMRRVVEEMPAPPAGVPAELQTVCLKCLEKARADRYPSAAALAEDLDRISRGEPVSAVRLTPAQALGRWARRRPQIATLLGLTAVSFLVGTAGVTWAWRKAVTAGRGETLAHQQATATIVDLYTQSGLAAARDGEPTRAALWFAKAAEATSDPAVRQENLVRQTVWRQETPTAVRAFQSEIGHVSRLSWNRAQTALIGVTRDLRGIVWEVATGTRWLPRPDFKIEAAAWSHHASWFVSSGDGFVRLTEYPSGREVARVPYRGIPPNLAVSADDQLVVVGGNQPFLWTVATGNVNPLPAALVPPRVLQFSPDGTLLLVCTGDRVGVCAAPAPEHFLFPPATCFERTALPGFLGSNRFYTSAGDEVIAVLDARTGETVERYTNNLVKGGGIPRAGSPDGRYIVNQGTPAIDRPVGFTDFPTLGNAVEQADFSEDSSLLATASYDSIVQLVPLPGGHPTTRVGWHQEGAEGVAISPDKRFLATSQEGGALVRVWRLGGPPVPREIPVSGGSGFRLSRDGRLLLPNGIAHYELQIERTRVHSVETGQPVGPEIVPGGVITDGDFMPDGSSVVLVCSSLTHRTQEFLERNAGTGTLQFWDFRTGEQLGEPVALPSEPRGVCVHPSGRWVATYTSRRELLEIDVVTRQVRTLYATTNHYGTTDAYSNGRCRYSPDGRFLVGWAMRQPPVLWDRQREKIIPAQPDGPAAVTDVDFQDGIMSSVSIESRLDFLTLPAAKSAQPSQQESDWLFLGRFSPDGDLFLTGGRSRIAHVWDWRRGVPLSPALRHTSEVFSGAFIPGTEWVVTAGVEGDIHLWNRRTGVPLRPVVMSDVAFVNLAVTPDGRTLIRGNFAPTGRSIALYDLAQLLPKPALPLPDAMLLAEIDAAAEIKNSAIEPLSAADWLKKWKEFEARRPEWHRGDFP